MFELYNKEKLVLCAPYLNVLVNVVETVKKYNKKIINRKNFKIKKENRIIYEWNKK